MVQFWWIRCSLMGQYKQWCIFGGYPNYCCGANASTLTSQAPTRFNLDQRSSRHVGRQGLGVLWQWERELWSYQPWNHYTLLGNSRRRLLVGAFLLLLKKCRFAHYVPSPEYAKALVLSFQIQKITSNCFEEHNSRRLRSYLRFDGVVLCGVLTV